MPRKWAPPLAIVAEAAQSQSASLVATSVELEKDKERFLEEEK